jgi:glutathione S-transferase
MSTLELFLHEVGDASHEGIESYSPFCLKVIRALRARHLAYRSVRAPFPAAHKLTSMGQVPVLRVGHEVIADSSRILVKIGQLSGRPFESGTPAERAEAWLYEELADTAVNGFVIASRWADDENWPRTRAALFGQMPSVLRWVLPSRLRAQTIQRLVARDIWRAGSSECWARLGELLDRFDARAPQNGFWMGQELTAADLALFGQLQSLRTSLTPKQRAQVESHGQLKSWLDRVDQATRV